MEQIQKFDQQESAERSIGNLFAEFLEEKGNLKGKNFLADFDKLQDQYTVAIVQNNVAEFVRNSKGFPASVREVLRKVVDTSVKVVFRLRVAGG